MFRLSGLRRFVIHFDDGFAHGGALEFEAVSVVDDAVEDGVRERRLADDVVPGLDGQKAAFLAARRMNDRCSKIAAGAEPHCRKSAFRPCC